MRRASRGISDRGARGAGVRQERGAHDYSCGWSAWGGKGFVIWGCNFWAASGGTGLFTENPLNGGGGIPWQMALQVANAFLPLDLILSQVALYWGYRLLVGAMWTGVAGLVKVASA